jgi:streptogramin lyase
VRRVALAVLLLLLPGSAEARVVKGSGPRSLAAAYGAVWVGFADGTVVRIDARTLRRVSLRVGRGAAGSAVFSLTAGFGSVWAAPGSFPVRRLDGQTGVVVAAVDQPGQWAGGSSLVGTGAGAVWIADHQRNAIYRVSPRTNRITRRLGLPHRLRGFATGSSGVWVQTAAGRRGPVDSPGGPRIISRLESRTLRVRRAIRLDCEADLEPHGRFLWVLDGCHGWLRRFDPRARVLGRPIETSPNAMTLEAAFGSVWVADGTRVHRVCGGRVVARIPARGLTMAAGSRSLWVLDHGDGVTGWLRRIDPATNRLVGRPIRLSGRE